MTVDRTLPVPLHAQVREVLGAQIADGVLAPGARLPTEVELAAQFGVHRLTVRQAMADLSRSGLVDVRQGVGTFVCDAPLPLEVDLAPGEWLGESERSARFFSERNIVVRHELVGVTRQTTVGAVAQHLGVEEALVVETRQLNDDRPVMRSLSWVVTPVAVDEVPEFSGSGAALLTGLVGTMYYAWRTLGAVAASLEDVAVLRVPIGSALVQRCGLNVDAAGRPVMFVDRRFRGDQIRFVVHRSDSLPETPADA